MKDGDAVKVRSSAGIDPAAEQYELRAQADQPQRRQPERVDARAEYGKLHLASLGEWESW